ncbi:MAG: ShlB/FhaC/HecB family hemolysin secretion/activation protein [Pseudomonadota bacterium]
MNTRGALICAALFPVSAACFAATPDSAPGDQFDVLEYRVLGNTVLPADQIERTLYPLLGPGQHLTDVEAARTALENTYHAAGYGTVLVDIPEQDTGEGIIRLKVTEGRVEQTTVSGARYFSARHIKAAVPESEAGTVPHLPTMQDELAALNRETSDRVVTPVLKSGRSPGTMALDLNVQDTLPLHGSVEFNNQYTTNTSHYRATLALSYDNLFQKLGSLSMQLQTAPESVRESKVWAASYTSRLPNDVSRLAAFYIHSGSNVASVGEAGTTIDVLGNGSIYGLRYISTLDAQLAATHVLVMGLEYKDFNESVFSKNVLETPISYMNLSVGPMSTWRFPQTQWSVSTTGNFGVGSLVGINSAQEFADKRFRAKPNYFFLRADGSMTRALPHQLELRLRVSGQYAMESIISNEQFSIAGADGVRGYLEAEVLGDVAIKSSLELGAPVWNVKDKSAQLFGFFDTGRMQRRNPLRQQDQNTGALGDYLEPRHVELSSAGVGAKLSLWNFLSADLTWAYPLDDAPAADGTRAHDSRLQFSLRGTW